jgi:hypothetical protein
MFNGPVCGVKNALAMTAVIPELADVLLAIGPGKRTPAIALVALMLAYVTVPIGPGHGT